MEHGKNSTQMPVEEIPPDIPSSKREKEMKVTIWVDADHAHDQVTQEISHRDCGYDQWIWCTRQSARDKLLLSHPHMGLNW